MVEELLVTRGIDQAFKAWENHDWQLNAG